MLKRNIPVAGEPGRCPVVPTGIMIESVESTFNVAPAVALVPPITAPVDAVTVPVTAKVLPSNVKFALSSIAPAVPAIITLLSVKSLIVALAKVASPLVPIVVNVPAAGVLPPTIPSMFPVTLPVTLPVKLPVTLPVTPPLAVMAPDAPIVVNEPAAAVFAPMIPSRLPVTLPVTLPVILPEKVLVNVVPSKVKLPLSPISPDAPAKGTLPDVKSVTRILPTANGLNEPENTELVSVASAIIINSDALSSKPIKAIFAPLLLYFILIPRSKLSSDESSPNSKIGSAILTVVLSTVVVVPVTVNEPAIVTVPPTPAEAGSIVKLPLVVLIVLPSTLMLPIVKPSLLIVPSEEPSTLNVIVPFVPVSVTSTLVFNWNILFSAPDNCASTYAFVAAS